MIGLFFSEAMLFAAAALVGFAVGWRLYVHLAQRRRSIDAADVEDLRAALSDAQVRRARIS
jgi:hypothetical protein